MAGLPVPDTVKVTAVMLTAEALGFVKRTCWTGTLVAPGSWFELTGGLGPCEADTVTAVGVEEGVGEGVVVAVEVTVKVGLFVGVAVAEDVGVLVAVEVAVFVAVEVAEFVGVPVGVGE